MIEILKVQEIVREAAKIFSNRNAAEQIKQKGVFDYVTAIDEAVQEFIQKELSDLYPQIQFMGEEKDNSDIDMSGQVWVLDPVDGTTNLIHDYQNSAISLALIDNSEIILGIIYKFYIRFLIIRMNTILSNILKYRKTLILPRIYHD